MALDVFFNKPESGAGTRKPGFYRGIVDTATKPTAKTKSQTVEIDFPGDMMSSSEIKVTEKSILPADTDREELKLKKCVLTRPQWLRSHSYSRTRLERSPSTVMFTLSGFHSVTAASP